MPFVPEDISSALLCSDECGNVWPNEDACQRLATLLNWAEATAIALDERDIINQCSDLWKLSQ